MRRTEFRVSVEGLLLAAGAGAAPAALEFLCENPIGSNPELPFHFANSKQYACFRMLKSNVPAK